MASDLGAWPAEQASVLLEVLQREGLTPEAKRTRDGIHVVVPDAQSDQAHQVLAGNMDAIASAARLGGPAGGRGRPARRNAPAKAAKSPRRRKDEPGSPRLTSERLLRAGPAVVVFLSVLLVANLLPPAVTLPVLVVGVFAGIWLLGRQAQREHDE